MRAIGFGLLTRLSVYRWRSLPEVIVPACTILALWLSGDRGKDFRLHAGQSILAGLSHLLLDMLTGVLPLALLYPYLQVFRLPFGLLPSAGKIQLTNYLFYRISSLSWEFLYLY